MKRFLLLIFSLTFLRAGEPRDLVDNPVSMAVPPAPQIIVYKDIKDLPAEAVRILESFNKEEIRLRSEYVKKIEIERTKLLKGLETAKVNATKMGNLEIALACKSLLGAMEGKPEAPERTENPSKGEPIDAITPGRDIPAIVWLSGNNGLTLRLNGTEVVKGGRNRASSARISITPGDVITVRNGDRFDINSYFVLITTLDGTPLVWTNTTWLSYIPPDRDSWWDIKGKKIINKPCELSGGREYVNLVANAASSIPGYNENQMQIVSSSLDPGTTGRESFILYTLTQRDFNSIKSK